MRRLSYIATALLGAAILAATSASAFEIVLDDAGSDRVERQRAAAAGRVPLADTPDLSDRAGRLAADGLAPGAAALVRVFKAESQLELWLSRDGVFQHFATYPICQWSGTLGPKQREGDRQTPEGFYTLTSRQIHRVGRWPRSLNVGFPNAFDRAQRRGGSYILIHGGCTSVGCLALTNPVLDEVHALVSAALRGGQRHVPVHIFPFRMTEATLSAHASSPWIGFWRNLKQGSDLFEVTRRAPRVTFCNGAYRFAPALREEASANGHDDKAPSHTSDWRRRLSGAVVESCAPEATLPQASAPTTTATELTHLDAAPLGGSNAATH